MKATIGPKIRNARNYGGDKEMVRTLTALVVSNANPSGLRKIVNVADARWYMGRSSSASRVYCSVWAGGNTGTGWAGGYGYDKYSAAFAEALGDADIRLSESVDGRGMGMVEEALEAICRARGFRGEVTIVRHG